MICMFGPTSDHYALLHRGTRCRKMHSSYRSTFRTIGDIPLAMVGEDFTYLTDDFARRDRTRAGARSTPPTRTAPRSSTTTPA